MLRFMTYRWRSVVVPALLLAAFLSSARSQEAVVQDEWKGCSDPDSSFVLRYPPSLIRSTAPGATACAFQTPDGDFNLEVVVETEAVRGGETLESRMQKEMDLLGGTVTYKRKEETWFVLSGITANGTEYYRKLYARGSRWVALHMTYPHERSTKFDPWVTRIEKTFVPFTERDQSSTE